MNNSNSFSSSSSNRCSSGYLSDSNWIFFICSHFLYIFFFLLSAHNF
jgi:hypothetical protein